jgi:hypothetical protein
MQILLYPPVRGAIAQAKAHIEKKWPYQIANTLPKLSPGEIASMQREVGLDVSDY